METKANDLDHLVIYDNDNNIDDLGYESEVYLDEEEDEDETNHSNGNVVKRGITRLSKFRKEYGKPDGIKLCVSFDALNRISGKHKALFLSFLGDMGHMHWVVVALRVSCYDTSMTGDNWEYGKPGGVKLSVTFDALNRISGKHIALFLSFLGDMVSEHIGLHEFYPGRRGSRTRNKTMGEIMRYFDVDLTVRKLVMNRLGQLLRNFRRKLRQTYILPNQDTPSKLNEVPAKYSAILKAEDWVNFVNYTATEEYKTSSQKALTPSLDHFDAVTRICDAVSTHCMPNLDHFRVELQSCPVSS
ncbi:hypothetical protein Tco_1493970 [Tanacetum coccineum]